MNIDELILLEEENKKIKKICYFPSAWKGVRPNLTKFDAMFVEAFLFASFWCTGILLVQFFHLSIFILLFTHALLFIL